MACKQNQSSWNIFDTNVDLDAKRKALERPGYLPPQHETGTLNHWSSEDGIRRHLPISGDYPLKKQKLDFPIAFGDESTSENEFETDETSYQYNSYGDNLTTSPSNLSCLESSENISHTSGSDRVFSPKSSRSTSSSRSCSIERNVGNNERLEDLLSDHQYRPTNVEQTIHAPQLTPVQVLRTIVHVGPTSLAPFNQVPETTLCEKHKIGAGRVPLSWVNENQTRQVGIRVAKSQSQDEHVDSLSLASSISDHASTKDPQTPEVSGPSEGEGSSPSKSSSEASDSRPTDSRANVQREDKLEALIKDDVLRTDPLVADIFYQRVKNELEYSYPEHTEKFEGNHEFSLLDLIELEAFGLVEHSETVTECAGSSTGSSSSQNTRLGRHSSASAQGAGSESTSHHPIKSGDVSRDGPSPLVKSTVNSGLPPPTKTSFLRCIHNAISPAIFKVNPDHQEKYRTCAGPGWSSIQHLKEHMQIHTKEVKKSTTLRCSRCQDEFSDPDGLKIHELNVDCPIRCPDCEDEFPTKVSRQDHQRQTHFEEENDPSLREIDDATWKLIKENLKSYTDCLKSRKAKSVIDPNPEREKWVLANIPRFETGRTKAKINAKLELGQWYTIFKTLEPNMEILEHPFYDYGNSNSDYAEERILSINDHLVDAKIQVHGDPPSDLEQQRKWYRDVLRESLRISSQTKRVSYMKGRAPSASRASTSVPLSGPTPKPSTIRGSGYNVPTLPLPSQPQVPRLQGMSNFTIAADPETSLLPEAEQQQFRGRWPLTGIGSNIPNGIIIDPTVVDYQFYGHQGTMNEANGQPFPLFNFHGQESQNGFEDMSNDPQYGWPSDEGGS